MGDPKRSTGNFATYKVEKNLNSRTIPENKNSQVISSTQNNPEQFKEFTEFQYHWAS